MTGPGWTQEIRFAGVFFGGVSLAIYMNGVAQELFRMVRSTADLDPAQLDPIEKIYRELGQILYLGRTPPDEPPSPDDLPARPRETDPIRTRFVIDVLSGTSAGGINAVALAKALALRLPSMAVLADTWRDDADLQTLLNDKPSDLRTYPKAEGRTTSLLNSEKMYAIIHRTLDRMNGAAPPVDGRQGFADEIDLFVTATDLNGLWKPVQLADKTIDERMHKTVFRFRYCDPALKTKLDTEPRNEFTSEYDPMLAFSARCTSSFPVAFEPMSLQKITPTLIRNNLGSFEEAKKKFERFFPNYTEKCDGSGRISFDRRLFADGGYLDNKPFSHAIDTIRYRTAMLPTTRKLLYLDPFPENASDRPFRDKITFLENAQLAASSLPRYETIRGDIEAIKDSNRLQERLERLRNSLAEIDEDTSKPPPKFNPDGTLTERIAEMGGGCYAVYHQLRVSSLTDAIAVTITRVAGFNEDSDQFAFVRSITRAWREATYDKEKRDGRKSQNRFLYEFDMAYRLRRLNHVRQEINARIEQQFHNGRNGFASDPQRCDALEKARLEVEKELVRLRQGGAKLCSPERSPIKDAVIALRDIVLTRQTYERVMGAPNWKKRLDAAAAIYDDQRTRKAIDDVADQLRSQLDGLFSSDQEIERQAEQWPEDVKLKFKQFVYHDMVTVPFLVGTDVQEYTRTEVYRVGPADAALRPKGLEDHPERKLAGMNAFDFGGFMSRAWRDNDMMWGRLDAADRIVTALLPAKGDQTLREHYLRRLQDVILQEELAINKNDRIANWFLQYAGFDAASRREQLIGGRAPGDPNRPVVQVQSFLARISAGVGRAVIPGLKERDLMRQAIKVLKKMPAGMMITKGEYRDFVEAYYQTPPPPPPATLSNWIGRGLTIFGDMVDEDGIAQARRDTAFGRSLRTLGVTMTKIVRFAMPNTLWQRIVRDWLGVLAISGVPLALAGLIFGVPNLTSFGVSVLIVFLLLIVLQQAVGVRLSGTSGLKRALRVPAFLVAAVLLLLTIHGAADAWSRVQTYVSSLVG